MASNITVPSLGESITEAIVASLTKSVGDFVVKNEILCELETEKVTIEVSVNVSGKLAELKVGVGDTVAVGSIIAIIDDNASLVSETPVVPISDVVHLSSCEKIEHDMPPAKSAVKMAQMINLDLSNVKGSGKRNQILKEDVINASMGNGAMCTDDHKSESNNDKDTTTESVSAESIVSEPTNVVPMSKLRQTIATRLKEAQNKAAILSTFNEIDMSAVMDLRAKYKDVFEKKHGIKIGFMSFFAKAAAVVLKEIPSVNAEISSSGNDIIFKNYYHIGVAVGIDRGLVVPVVRHVDRMSFADIEKAISALGKKARDYKLSMSDMRGGTFTISNGGIYGSLLSTPIINTPQSGILGLHNIVQRPVVVDGAIVIRPMMYVALSYDHRLVDGKDAVTFLVRIKQLIECPQRLLLAL